MDFNSTTTTIFSETNNPLFVTKNYKFFKINGRGGMGLVVAIVKSPVSIAINPLVRSVFQLAIGLFMAVIFSLVLLDASGTLCTLELYIGLIPRPFVVLWSAKNIIHKIFEEWDLYNFIYNKKQ